VQITSWPKYLLSMKKASLSDKKQRAEFIKEKLKSINFDSKNDTEVSE
jgi:hypothetical protein